jgi:hypothetical protein
MLQQAKRRDLLLPPKTVVSTNIPQIKRKFASPIAYHKPVKVIQPPQENAIKEKDMDEMERVEEMVLSEPSTTLYAGFNKGLEWMLAPTYYGLRFSDKEIEDVIRSRFHEKCDIQFPRTRIAADPPIEWNVDWSVDYPNYAPVERNGPAPAKSPKNPLGRTGKSGRHDLAKFGPNEVRFTAFTYVHPAYGPSGCIERVDAGGELILTEPMWDPANTDDAWLEKHLYHVKLDRFDPTKEWKALSGADLEMLFLYV